MIEDILNKINTNLERIANALEKGGASGVYVQPLENANFLAGTSKKVVDQVKEVQNQNNVVPVAPIVQQGQAIPTDQIVPMPVAPIPTTPVQESFTMEQLARAMSNAVSAGKMDVIQGILKQLNVQALTQINPADYNKLAVMLKEAGVEI